MIYDLFYVSFGKIKDENWNKFRSRFPISKKIENVKSLTDITPKAFTKLFWVVWDDLEILDDTIFDYVVPKWDEQYVHVFKNGEHFDGVNIFSKYIDVTDKEFRNRFFLNKKEIDRQVSIPRSYDIFLIETYDDYLNALENSSTELFWMSGNNLTISEEFKFDFHFPYYNRVDISSNHSFLHVVGDKKLYNGVHLLSKYKPVSKREIEHRFLIEKREWPIVASGPVKYDIFNIETYKDYCYAIDNSSTEMFWMTSPNIDTSNFNFDIYFSHDQKYERNENHAFIHKVDNKDLYNGVFLLSKNNPISKKEVEHRHIINRKEWPVVASGPVKYDIFNIETYEDYLCAMKESKTEMFWMTSPNIDTGNFNFDIYFSHDQQYERTINHSFIHRVNGKDLYNGVHLLSKHKPVTKKEIEHRFLIEKKEWPIVASGPVKYDIFDIENYDDYLVAMKESKTEMFWMTSSNINTGNFNFDVYFSHDQKYERTINHSFIHRVNDKDLYNGLHLLSKHKQVTKKEIEHRFLIEKREWPIVASGPVVYDIFDIETYEDYCYAIDNSSTEMFWMTSPNIDTSNFNFDIYFSHDQKYERNENHAFIHRANGKDLYNGVHLLSKHKPVTKKEIEHRHIINRKEWPIVASGPVVYDIFDIETYEDYLDALTRSKTEMFWMTSLNIDTGNFNFDIYFSHDQQYERTSNHSFIHRVNSHDLYNGLHLLSKHKQVTKKEIEHRFLIEKKEWPIVASGPVKYDIFDIENYDDYLVAMKESKTEMFWMTSSNLDTNSFNFDVYFSHDQKYERTSNHSFIHRVNDKDLYNGVHLLSKHKQVTKKEIEHRFLIEKKEWPIVASGPVKYDIFDIENYDDYLVAMKESKTEMFWMTSPNIDTSGFEFNIYFSKNLTYERNENHAFIHRVNEKNYYNGLFLLSKNKKLSKKEIEHRFLIEKKEWPIVASGPVKYDIFNIETYDDYLTAMKESKTEMFWMTSPNIDTSNFEFSTYFTHNEDLSERMTNHSFIHLVGDKKLYNGLHLLSKHKPITKKEVDHRFLVEKKEWPIVASGPVEYDKFIVDTYDDYLNALSNAKTEMFWIIPKEAQVIDNLKFNLYFSHDNIFDRKSNHVFGHIFRGETSYTGISLVPKSKKLTKKEIDFRHIIERKEHTTIFSRLKPYDIVFISYDELNADENYQALVERFPRAKRVHGVKGIHNAHIEAAKISETDMFWVVDGDALISDEFNFDHEVSRYELDIVHVWQSKNPINDLTYGYGGVKLLPKKLTENMDTSKPDMTTSISMKFKSMPFVSNVTNFNTDPFNTWKSAFRECVKLSSKIIDRQEDTETDFRLDAWCSSGKDKPFGIYAISGANAGRKFGEENKNNLEQLSKINDFDWLQHLFSKTSP